MLVDVAKEGVEIVLAGLNYSQHQIASIAQQLADISGCVAVVNEES